MGLGALAAEAFLWPSVTLGPFKRAAVITRRHHTPNAARQQQLVQARARHAGVDADAGAGIPGVAGPSCAA
jgi:hypothetical protein